METFILTFLGIALAFVLILLYNNIVMSKIVDNDLTLISTFLDKIKTNNPLDYRKYENDIRSFLDDIDDAIHAIHWKIPMRKFYFSESYLNFRKHMLNDI